MVQEYMDSKITDLIKKSSKKPALIPFIVSGYPDIETTKELIYLFQKHRVAAIELGIPFSDPLADGPVIQEAANESLKNGTNIDVIFKMLGEIQIFTPIILFSYFNPIISYGIEKFIQKAKACNVSGLIIPDLPIDESEEVSSLCKKYGLDHIMLVAPTSDKSRIANIAKHSSGFIYLVSSTGVTGVRDNFSDLISEIATEIKSIVDTPIAVGFGVSKPEHIQNLKDLNIDGAIIGSAIIKLIKQVAKPHSQDTNHSTDSVSSDKFDKNLLLSKLSEYLESLYQT